jgi:hypothetical protein
MPARMAGEKAGRPKFMRIAKFFGFTAGQVGNPRLSLSGDRRLLAGPRPVIKRCHRTIGQRPLDAALGRLMVHPNGTPDRKKRRIIPIGQQYPRPLYAARRFRARAANRFQRRYVILANRQFDRPPPSCHELSPCRIKQSGYRSR